MCVLKHLLLLLLVTVFLSSSTSAGEIGAFDARLSRDVANLRLHVMNRTMPVVSEVGEWQYLLGSTLLLAGFGKEKTSTIGRSATIALLSTEALSVGVKCLTDRKRPSGRHSRVNSSFPSGHTATAVAVATVIGSRYPDLRVPLYSFAGLVAYSRIYNRKHYIGDVLAGGAIGYLSGRLILHYRLSW